MHTDPNHDILSQSRMTFIERNQFVGISSFVLRLINASKIEAVGIRFDIVKRRILLGPLNSDYYCKFYGKGTEKAEERQSVSRNNWNPSILACCVRNAETLAGNHDEDHRIMIGSGSGWQAAAVLVIAGRRF
uniref:Uncharacterized protein n=1 Tax=Vespula pensylvanica TaxID=30213 RepID=A0A834P8P2_VESPE|nr:hypothetical protein H0235_005187 [Vespula pensylvanica]